MFKASARRANGYAIWTYAEGVPKERDTLQCVHCGKHWFVEVGSGRERGWCGRCMGVTCGEKPCLVCIPLMKAIEESEEKARKLSLICEG